MIIIHMDVVQPRSYSSAYAAAVELPPWCATGVFLLHRLMSRMSRKEIRPQKILHLAQDPSGTSQESKVALGQLQGRGASDFDQLPSLARSWRLHFSCGLDAQALQLLLHLQSKVPPFVKGHWSTTSGGKMAPLYPSSYTAWWIRYSYCWLITIANKQLTLLA